MSSSQERFDGKNQADLCSQCHFNLDLVPNLQSCHPHPHHHYRFHIKPEEAMIIEMQEPVSLTFELKYLNPFSKATSLVSQVTINIQSDMPTVFEYKMAEMAMLGSI